MNILINYLDGLCRAYPIMVIVAFISFGVIFGVKLYLIFALLLILESLANVFVWKPLCKTLWTRWPSLKMIFGAGERPCLDNCDCGNFSNRGMTNNNIAEYGMPSGHSQIAFSVATFWTLYLYQLSSSLSISFFISAFYLIVTSFLVAVSRIIIACHTVGQVMVGSVLGLMMGFINYGLVSVIM